MSSHVALRLVLALVGCLVAAGLVRRLALAGADSPHERWVRGECASCHESDRRADPEFHDERFKSLDHGRIARSGRPGTDPTGCGTCHEPKECIKCHAQRPSSHVPSFLDPGLSRAGSGLHGLLGRLDPGRCAFCHRDTSACAVCHDGAELRRLREAAVGTLAPFAPTLGLRLGTKP
ncbi:MAG: hypothetical protein HYV07_29555 [Deltaproteobacteria bacterium]|nr:hypothetical protein [Deltaproteobacteria bacterium]